MYAIIENGSHQYRVQEGDLLSIDRRPGEHGTEITFDKVLLIAGTEGEPSIGAPYVTGATVGATIEQTFRTRKLTIRKFRRRKGYRRKKGHRQHVTNVRITRISVA
jgi:large subunit ribosomal protein L21